MIAPFDFPAVAAGGTLMHMFAAAFPLASYSLKSGCPFRAQQYRNTTRDRFDGH
jgi:hypothetical protein